MKVLRSLIKRLFDPTDHDKVTRHHNSMIHDLQVEMTGIRSAPHPYRSVRFDRDCHKQEEGDNQNGHRSSKAH